MKRFFCLSMMFFWIFSITTVTGFSQTAQDILDKMVAAQGGKDKFSTITSRTTTATINIISQGMTGSSKTYWKAPNKLRSDMELPMGTLIRVYDGEKAWLNGFSTGGVPKEVSGPEILALKRQSIGEKLYIEPGKYNVTFTFKGKEKVKEVDCLVLEQTFENIEVSLIYLDAKTYLVQKISSVFQDKTNEYYLSDYKKIDGIMIAHTISVVQGGQEALVVKVNEVKFNLPIDDSLFILTPPPPQKSE